MTRLSFYLYRFVSVLVLAGMLLGPLAPAFRVRTADSAVAPIYSPSDQQTLYRTRVELRHPGDLQRVASLTTEILQVGEDWALVVVNDDQLSDLARLQFRPRQTDTLSNLGFSSESLAFASGRQALVEAVASDADGDGLTDIEESWWCTDPNNPNSDIDPQGHTDGEEIDNLLDFTAPRSVRYAYGPPYTWHWGDPNNPWGTTPWGTQCYDGDWDSIPDSAEAKVIGLRTVDFNGNWESTDGDKFDDGQELFGTTIPNRGSLPLDWGIGQDLPAWVEPPGDHPLVAAFPVPEVFVVPGSWTVERVTTITTQQGQILETTHSYETSATRGQSTSIANTVSWNNWEEVSQAVETPLDLTRGIALLVESCSGQGLGCYAWGATKLVGGVLGAVGSGAITALGAASCLPTAGGGCIVAGVGGVATAGLIGVAGSGWDDLFGKDESQNVNQVNVYNSNTNVVDVSATATAQASAIVNNNFDFQGVVNSLDGIQYAISQQGELLSRGLYDISYQLSRPRFTETRTNGRSWGGSQTTTQEVYEEHTISEGEAFTTGENWSTAWAVDSSHAADLTFNYTIQNTGTEFAREITGLVFNIYLGDDPNPIISYPAWQQFPNGTLENLFPGDTFNAASNPVPLTLEQMKRIDLGERIVVVPEDFSYGLDEQFYENAVNRGVTFFIEDGVEDGDELVDMYVIPTWGVESIQDVMTRYFLAGVDNEGNLNSLWTPEFNGTTTPTWNEHFLSDIAWWNIYLSQSNVGSTPLHELSAVAGSALLFRFNRDSDRDGYQDRVEMHYYCSLPDTDPDAAFCPDAHERPEIYPKPEVLAGYVSTRNGNEVTVLLKVANQGTFDAYGIDAVMYAPDDTVTIGNNTVGGNGRVRPGTQVAVGSLVLPPELNNWTNSTAVPYATGNYIGSTDKVFTFTVNTSGVVGQGSTAMNWTDGVGGNGTLALGSTYQAPLPIDVAEGLLVGFDTGDINPGESFSVAALTPRDTFTYTINAEPYTPPVIVVSYSDPQGSHKFITPISLTSLISDVTDYSGQMLPDARLDITAIAPVDPTGTNTTYFTISSPHPEPIEDAHLYLNFVADGELVAELPFTMTLLSGPTVIPIDWSTSIFSQTYDANADNILIAFWTDAQNNIIDSAARPFPTFQEDATAEAATSTTNWDFGTITQGQVVRTQVAVASTGLAGLLGGAAVTGDGLSVSLGGASNVSPASFQELEIVFDSAGLPAGPYSGTVSIRTNDIDNPQTVVHVSGIISPLVGDAFAYEAGVYRPWDQTVFISGTNNLNDPLTFNHTIPGDASRIHPLYVYSEDGTTLLGVGEYGPDFTGATAPFGIFGNGSDGDLTISTNTNYEGRNTGVAGNHTAGATTIQAGSTANFTDGDIILIHQTRGAGAGTWEINEIASVAPPNFNLVYPLKFSYSDDGAGGGGANQAQILVLKQYRSVTIQAGGKLFPPTQWDGSKGGILAFLVSETLDVQAGGMIDVSGKGFFGGATSSNAAAIQGESASGVGINSTSANNTGGGGGALGNGAAAGGGGGGGLGTTGIAGQPGARGGGAGGNTGGSPDLTMLIFGGAGGGGGTRDGGSSSGGTGGNSGGIVFIGARSITLNASSSILATGSAGGAKSGSGSSGGGGGGAGGSILLRVGSATLGSTLITSLGGGGGAGNSGSNNDGGAGGVGRIRIEYCETLSGNAQPPASTQQMTCYIARQLPGNPNTELTLPEAVNGYVRYLIQYGQRGTFTSLLAPSGTQDYSITIPKRQFGTITLDLLFENLGNSSFNFTVDVGANGSVEWSGNGSAQPVILNSPDLSNGLNIYLAGTPNAWGEDVAVPVRVTLNTTGDVFLTAIRNMEFTRGRDAIIRLNLCDIS